MITKLQFNKKALKYNNRLYFGSNFFVINCNFHYMCNRLNPFKSTVYTILLNIKIKL